MSKVSDEFDRQWITEQSIDVCSQYEFGVLTLRALHYQLVSRGMTNTIQHYKRVVSAMIKARRNGDVAYEQFSDHDRQMIGETSYEETDLEQLTEHGQRQVELWMESYSKNRWENQDDYIELWIEKKALQGVFGPVADEREVALCPCKGYPSLTFLNQAACRFQEADSKGKRPVIVYFGDHDPSGEDIPRSIEENLENDFGVSVKVDVIGLTAEQCIELELPPAPAKTTDSRTKNFSGLGQVELDAVAPETLQDWARNAIDGYFSNALHEDLLATEDEEREIYIAELKKFVEAM